VVLDDGTQHWSDTIVILLVEQVSFQMMSERVQYIYCRQSIPHRQRSCSGHW